MFISLNQQHNGIALAFNVTIEELYVVYVGLYIIVIIEHQVRVPEPLQYTDASSTLHTKYTSSYHTH